MGRVPCCDRDIVKKGPWTPEEDLLLVNYIQIHGPGSWRSLPKNSGLQRCGKSCRLRWTNYLRPDIRRGRFSFEEEETIIQLHSILGNKWSSIAARLPGRTDNEIKNYWNTHIRKRLLRNGIDPVTHKPRLDFLDLSTLLTSPLGNLSSLFGTTVQATSIINPELFTLFNNFISLKQQNPEILLQHLQQNQDCNIPRELLENQVPFPQTSDHDQLQNDIYKLHNQTPLMQENVQLLDQSFQATESTKNNRDFRVNSGISTPLSSSTVPMSSCSTFMNGSSTNAEDDRESNSSLFKFEIAESLDFDEFMRTLI